MSDKLYEGIAKFSEAVLAIQNDPKKTKGMIDEIKSNFAMTDDLVSQYNTALDTIASAKQATVELKKVQDALAANQSDLTAAQFKLASDRADLDNGWELAKDTMATAKSYDAELKTAKSQLDSRETAIAAREAKGDAKDEALNTRETAIAAREATFEQAKSLIG